jgi:hypothetical protein
MKFLLVFLVIFMVFVANLDSGMLSSVGIDGDIMIGALIALVITGLTVHHNLALIVLILLLCIGANLPQGVLEQWEVDRHTLIATLVALVLLPKIKQLLE